VLSTTTGRSASEPDGRPDRDHEENGARKQQKAAEVGPPGNPEQDLSGPTAPALTGQQFVLDPLRPNSGSTEVPDERTVDHMRV